MEAMIIRGNAPSVTDPGWSNPVPAARVVKPVQPLIDTAPKVDQAAVLAESLEEIGVRNQEAVKVLSERLQSFLDASSYSLQFVPDRENSRVIIKVLDNSGKVIRQIPPEQVTRLSDGLESLTGLLLDERLE